MSYDTPLRPMGPVPAEKELGKQRDLCYTYDLFIGGFS